VVFCFTRPLFPVALALATWVMKSVADTAIVPMQDLLGRGSEARMNLPNSTQGNWTWRFKEDDLSDDHAGRLREMTQTYSRK
jgi:4-alpha-glucanotransferase